MTHPPILMRPTRVEFVCAACSQVRPADFDAGVPRSLIEDVAETLRRSHGCGAEIRISIGPQPVDHKS